MTDTRLRVVAIPPGAEGLSRGLHACSRVGSIVTAYDDQRLRLASQILAEDDDVEFVAFGDFVGQVLRLAGAPCERLVTRKQREAMTALACLSLAGDSQLEKAARLPGMARLINDRIDELSHFGMGPNVLHTLETNLGLETWSKVQTIAEVAELVQDSMDASHRETVTERIERCFGLSGIENGPVLHVIVIAGPEERPLYDQWLEWLAGQGIEVDFLLDLIPGRTDLFLTSQRSVSRTGSSPRTVIGESKWFECLFTSQVSDVHPKIEVVSAADALSECEWIVRDCLALREKGLSPSTIGIFVRDTDLYAPLLVAVAERHGLPLTLTRNVPLLSSGFANIVLQSLKACTTSDVRHIARLGKNNYFQTDPKAFDILWKEASQLSRGGLDGWQGLTDWLAMTETDFPWLRSLVDWRAECINGSARLSKWLERFRSLFGETAITESTSSTDPNLVARDLRAQTVLQRSIADLAYAYDQAGLDELTLVQFVQLIERVWKDETITVRDEVRGVVVCNDAAALPSFDHLFVPGMLEGTMPKKRREDPLLNDSERAELSARVGVRLRNSRDDSREERDHFVRLCAAANSRLVFSYPLTDNERDNIPAFYLEEVKRTVSNNVTMTNRPRNVLVPEAEECLSEADKNLRLQLDVPPQYPVVPIVSADWALNLIRPSWSKGVTPSELAQVLTCPFRSMFYHRLKVRPPVRTQGIWILLQLPGKANLPTAASRLVAEARLHNALEVQLDEASPELELWEIELLRATGTRLIMDWVDREFRSRSLWPRSSTLINVNFGSDGLQDSLKIDGEEVKILASAPALLKIHDVSVIQFYEPGLPKLDDFRTKIESEEEAFEYGLYLMVQFGRSPGGLGLEIDAASGQRVFAFLGQGGKELRGDLAAGLVLKGLDDSMKAVMQATKSRLKAAKVALDSSRGTAVPNKHCDKCLYGEICRVSTEFGEELSPFGQDERT